MARRSAPRARLPQLQPEERPPGRAAAGRHRRGELRPHVVSAGRSNTYTTLTATQCTNTSQNAIGHYTASPMQTITVPNRGGPAYHNATTYPAGCLMSTNNSAASPLTAHGSTQRRIQDRCSDVGTKAAAVGTSRCPGSSTRPGHPDGLELPADRQRRGADEQRGGDRSRAAPEPPRPRSAVRCSTRTSTSRTVHQHRPQGLLPSQRHRDRHRRGRDLRRLDRARQHLQERRLLRRRHLDVLQPEVNQACLLAKAGVKIYVITDTTADNPNDAIAAAGGTNASISVSLTDPNAAKAAIVGIIAQDGSAGRALQRQGRQLQRADR